ncbi:hypothetical protein AOLI_G00024790 [Acnodon oligacanthus]
MIDWLYIQLNVATYTTLVQSGMVLTLVLKDLNLKPDPVEPLWFKASRGATASLAANEAKRTDTIQISALLWSETFTTKNPPLTGSSSSSSSS